MSKKSYGVLYYQDNNVKKKMRKWIEELLEDGKIVYLQSGTPPPPPNPPK